MCWFCVHPFSDVRHAKIVLGFCCYAGEAAGMKRAYVTQTYDPKDICWYNTFPTFFPAVGRVTCDCCSHEKVTYAFRSVGDGHSQQTGWGVCGEAPDRPSSPKSGDEWHPR